MKTIELVFETWESQSTPVVASLCGVFAVSGALVANIMLPHLVDSYVLHGVLAALSSGFAVIVGFTLFSIVIGRI